MPITAELPGGGVALIQEAANFNRQWSGIKFPFRMAHAIRYIFRIPAAFPPLILGNALARHPGE